MDPSTPCRVRLFDDEPIAELRGLGTLTDPDDDEVAAVVDLAIIGARGDGKTQFIVHAVRALHGQAPALAGAEQRLNQDLMRLVLDPRATRPEATPPGVVPHFTFRVRSAGLLDRLDPLAALGLAWRAGRIGVLAVVAAAMVLVGLAIGIRGEVAGGIVVAASGALLAGVAALVARGRIDRQGDVEVAFWDIAGEQVYSAGAADYHTLLGRLVDARRRRAEQRGRAYAFVPVLICNPLALGTTVDEGSPFERLRELLPMFAALDREPARALIAINRWSVVDPICARGSDRDEVVTIRVRARGESTDQPFTVAREQVRAQCLDAEDGRAKGVKLAYLRYDTAIRSAVDVEPDGAVIAYEYDEGPSAFSGDAKHRFVEWVVGLVRWQAPRAAAPSPVAASSLATATASVMPAHDPGAAPHASYDALRAAASSSYAPTGEVWARPADAARPR